MAEARKRYQEFLDKASFAQDRLVDEVRRRMADLLSASKQDKPPVLHPITYLIFARNSGRVLLG
jgi:hypothetical protein